MSVYGFHVRSWKQTKNIPENQRLVNRRKWEPETPESLEDFWKRRFPTIGDGLGCPPSQDASHHQDDITFLVGDPEPNLHLPQLLGGGQPKRWLIFQVHPAVLGFESMFNSTSQIGSERQFFRGRKTSHLGEMGSLTFLPYTADKIETR